MANTTKLAQTVNLGWRTVKVRAGLLEEIERLLENNKLIADVPKYQSITEFVNEGAARLLQQEKRRIMK